MPLPTSLLAHSATWSRRTAVLATGVGPYLQTPARTFPHPVYVQAEATAGLTFGVTGTSEGVPTTEVVTVPSATKVARGIVPFDVVSTIQVTAAASVSARAVYESGADAATPAVITAALMGRFFTAVRPATEFGQAGPHQLSKAFFLTNRLDVVAGDQMAIDGATYTVEHVQLMYAATQKHHLRATLQQT